MLKVPYPAFWVKPKLLFQFLTNYCKSSRNCIFLWNCSNLIYLKICNKIRKILYLPYIIFCNVTCLYFQAFNVQSFNAVQLSQQSQNTVLFFILEVCQDLGCKKFLLYSSVPRHRQKQIINFATEQGCAKTKSVPTHRVKTVSHFAL